MGRGRLVEREQFVLSLLSARGEAGMHMREIRKRLAQHIEKSLSSSAVALILQRLRQEGFVESREEGARKVYFLTPAGMTAKVLTASIRDEPHLSQDNEGKC